jgi:hypothetical protein
VTVQPLNLRVETTDLKGNLEPQTTSAPAVRRGILALRLGSMDSDVRGETQSYWERLGCSHQVRFTLGDSGPSPIN